MPAAARLATVLARLVRLDAGVDEPPPPRRKGSGIDVAFAEAIAWHRQRDPITDDEWEALTQAARRRAFTVANLAHVDLVAEVARAIDRAVADGTTLADFKAEIGETLRAGWSGVGRAPAASVETIFRTNVQTAYAAGHYQQAQALIKARPYWEFDGVPDSRQTEICAELHGTIRRADDPWWDRRIPPLHHQCRSAIRTLTEAQARARGVTTDDDLPETDAADGFGARPEAPASLADQLASVVQNKVKAIREHAPALADVAQRKLDASLKSMVSEGLQPQPRPNAKPVPSDLKPSGPAVGGALEVRVAPVDAA